MTSTQPEREEGKPIDFEVREDDWVPTPHGKFLGEVLRSTGIAQGKDVLELGGGVGNHTIILLETGAKSLVTTEITPALSETTKLNVERHVPEAKVEYRVADWLSTEGDFDLLVTNPPFAKSGQRNRRYFIDSLILDSHKRLRPEGRLFFVQSSMADVKKSLRRLEENRFEAEVIATSRGPWRDYYFQDPTFLEESKRVDGGFEVGDDGTHYETLSVISAKLRPWSPPDFAHLPASR